MGAGLEGVGCRVWIWTPEQGSDQGPKALEPVVKRPERLTSKEAAARGVEGFWSSGTDPGTLIVIVRRLCSSVRAADQGGLRGVCAGRQGVAIY